MGAAIFLVFIALVIILLFSLSRSSKARGEPDESLAHSLQSSTRLAKPPALEAMRRAGYDVGDEFVRVTDIGLLEYRDSQRPRLLRAEPIHVDADYVRPFVELWLPYRSRGMVRFELIERIGGRTRLHYADEDEYDLKAGINALLPGTWLPVQGKAIETTDQWHLRILAGETILADHAFGWREVSEGSHIQRYIASDGEISAALQQAISAQQNESISLDDLLGGQD